MKVIRLADTFDGNDLVVRVHHGEREARVNAATVNVDGACSALAVVAALLGARQGKVFAEAVKEGGARIETESVGLAVDLESQGHCPFGEGFFRRSWRRNCRGRRCCQNRGCRSGKTSSSKMREKGATADAAGLRRFDWRSYGSRVGIRFGIDCGGDFYFRIVRLLCHKTSESWRVGRQARLAYLWTA
jgi:hypothetical protein